MDFTISQIGGLQLGGGDLAESTNLYLLRLSLFCWIL